MTFSSSARRLFSVLATGAGLLLSAPFAQGSTETYDAELGRIAALADQGKCWTFQRASGLTGEEFARLRAACWRRQNGDEWASRNPIYDSQVMSGLERPETPEETQARVRAAQNQQAGAHCQVENDPFAGIRSLIAMDPSVDPQDVMEALSHYDPNLPADEEIAAAFIMNDLMKAEAFVEQRYQARLARLRLWQGVVLGKGSLLPDEVLETVRTGGARRLILETMYPGLGEGREIGEARERGELSRWALERMYPGLKTGREVGDALADDDYLLAAYSLRTGVDQAGMDAMVAMEFGSALGSTTRSLAPRVRPVRPTVSLAAESTSFRNAPTTVALDNGLADKMRRAMLQKATVVEEGRYVLFQRVANKEGVVVFEGTVDLQPTLNRIRNGELLPHSNDGARFENRPLRKDVSKLSANSELPANARFNYYREFRHPTPGMQGPGPQRVVIGYRGEIWYTPDHYRSFVRIQ